MSRLLGLGLLVLSACGGSGTSDPDSGVVGQQCSAANDTCAGDTVCIGNACQSAFTRAYSVGTIAIQVPTTKPDGTSWDLGGGAPDLFVAVATDDAVVGMTGTVQDQFSASYADTFTVTLASTTKLDVIAWDEDISSNDPVFTCEANPVTAANLRGRALQCVTNGFSLTFTIQPK